MRRVLLFVGLTLACVPTAWAKSDPAAVSTPSAPSPLSQGDGSLDVSADKSLEWYQDQHIYVARGNAKAIRGETTIEADILTAHERDKDETPPVTTPSPAGAKTPADQTGGNIDMLYADGHVHITDPRQQIFGERAVYDLNRKVAKVTGDNLKYQTERDVVTAKDSLEYFENENISVARGHTVDVHDDRHIEGDVLTAHFRDLPPSEKGAGQKEMTQMTAEGNVVVITPTDVARGDRAVYDIKRNAAVLTGHVRITRTDTQLSGDVAEVDFANGQSRLLNEGKGKRVRALLVSKPKADKTDKTNQKAGTQ